VKNTSHRQAKRKPPNKIGTAFGHGLTEHWNAGQTDKTRGNVDN
jgi:hypothetical protein